MIIEYPPRLHGTPEEQIAQLQAYLVRLVRQLDEALREGGNNVSSTSR